MIRTLAPMDCGWICCSSPARLQALQLTRLSLLLYYYSYNSVTAIVTCTSSSSSKRCNNICAHPRQSPSVHITVLLSLSLSLCPSLRLFLSPADRGRKSPTQRSALRWPRRLNTNAKVTTDVKPQWKSTVFFHFFIAQRHHGVTNMTFFNQLCDNISTREHMKRILNIKNLPR